MSIIKVIVRVTYKHGMPATKIFKVLEKINGGPDFAHSYADSNISYINIKRIIWLPYNFLRTV